MGLQIAQRSAGTTEPISFFCEGWSSSFTWKFTFLFCPEELMVSIILLSSVSSGPALGLSLMLLKRFCIPLSPISWKILALWGDIQVYFLCNPFHLFLCSSPQPCHSWDTTSVQHVPPPHPVLWAWAELPSSASWLSCHLFWLRGVAGCGLCCTLTACMELPADTMGKLVKKSALFVSRSKWDISYHGGLQLASPHTHMLPSEQHFEFINLPLGFYVNLVIRFEIHFCKMREQQMSSDNQRNLWGVKCR